MEYGSNISNINLFDGLSNVPLENILNNKWYHITITFENPFNDDLTLFSKYNLKNSLSGSVSNLIIKNSSGQEVRKYNFEKYNNNNRFENLISGQFDLKVNGNTKTGYIPDLYGIDLLYNNNITTQQCYNDPKNNIILFFKNIKSKYLVY